MVGGSNRDVEIKNLKRINILFGKNGTGKSTFFRNLYQSDSETYHLVVPERGGTELKYSSGLLDQENDVSQRKNHRNKNYDSSYRNRAISRASGILTHRGYENLHGIQSSLFSSDDLTSLFKVFLPEFDVLFSDKAPFDLEIFRDGLSGKEKIDNVDKLSSGQAEALSLASDIITQGFLWFNKKDKTLLIDEPDAHLHVDLENRFAIFISEVASKFDLQVIIATHSPGLIASLLNIVEEVGIVCFDSKDDSINTIKKDNTEIFTSLISIDLSLAVVLKRKIVIVEGNDDFLVWNQATRSQNFKDISLIQANGGDILKYKNNAEKILRAVLDDREDKLGITILDKDDKEDFISEEKNLLFCKRLNCYSLENLFLAKEIIDFVQAGINLNDKLEELKKQVNITQEESDSIDKLIENKKDTKISKDLIKKIHSFIDEHSSSRDWRIILGKFIGRNKPSGELAEFIGEDIVDYIWNN